MPIKLYIGRLLGLLVCLGLGACAPPAATRPPPGDGLSPRVRLGDDLGVRVEPVDGPALPMAWLLARSVAEGLRELDLPATTDRRATAAYLLKGRAEMQAGQPGAPFVVLVHWTLLSMSGEEIGSHIQGVRGTEWHWQYGDPKMIRAVGKGTARPVAAMIEVNTGKPTTFERPKSGLLVESVEGAPGDGNTALRRAITAAMRATDISITEDLRQTGYVLRGRVTVAATLDGRRKATIVWTVTTLDGREMGKATQVNTVAAGSLDGAWGHKAVVIAAAAVEGIERILGMAERIERMKPKTDRPPPPELPQIPGRGPPLPR